MIQHLVTNERRWCFLEYLDVASIVSILECSKGSYGAVTQSRHLQNRATGLVDLLNGIKDTFNASCSDFVNIIPRNDKILSVAHRGASGHCKANTLEAFFKAIDLGADIIELDVHVCGTGEIIVYHDAFLPNGLIIAETPFRTLKRHMPKMPTIIETLQRLAGYGVTIYFDLKGLNIVDALWDILLDCVQQGLWDPSQFIIAAFDQRFLVDIARKREQCQCMKAVHTAVIIDGVPLGYTKKLSKFGISYFSTSSSSCVPELIEDAHSRGIKVLAWTVNEKWMMTRLLEMGVDGIISDFPDVVGNTIRIYGGNFAADRNNTGVWISSCVVPTYIRPFYGYENQRHRQRVLDGINEAHTIYNVLKKSDPAFLQLDVLQTLIKILQENAKDFLQPMLFNEKVNEKVKGDSQGRAGNEFIKEIAKSLPLEKKQLFYFEHEWVQSWVNTALAANSVATIVG